MNVEIKFNEETRNLVKDGVNALADAVKVTLGPRGKNAIIKNKYTIPTITNDGVTIAKSISFGDDYQDIGAQLVKHVAEESNDTAGDGTTTATILMQALVNEGYKYISTGYNPILIRKGMKIASEWITNTLKDISIPVAGKEDIARIATISSQDEKIGSIIADAIEKVGKDATITLSESNTLETTLETLEGMNIDAGYISSYMITDIKKSAAAFVNPLILVTDKHIFLAEHIIPAIEIAMKEGRPIIIIADEIDGEALSAITVNITKGIFKCACIKVPGIDTEEKKELLEDIAIFTGATVISSDTGLELSEVTRDQLGAAKSIYITKDKTSILEGENDKELLNSRVDQIKELIEKETSEYKKEKIKNRLSRLTCGAASINIGAATKTELEEIKLRAEDAYNAVVSALEEGIVAGGGTALVVANTLISNIKHSDPEVQIGIDIVAKALTAPLKQIAINSNKSADIILKNVIEALTKEGSTTMGYDAYNDEIVDMIKNGIIDPTKVTRCAIQNAISGAATLLTADVMIIERE